LNIFHKKVYSHLKIIYQDILPDEEINNLTDRIFEITPQVKNDDKLENWNEGDIFLISYGDSIVSAKDKKLKTLKKFFDEFITPHFNNVHILPFFPFSSDDGFSITDYKKVRDDLGSWEDISLLSKDYRVMADIVINHASKQSEYFQELVGGNDEYKDFFITLDNNEGFEEVVRPRSSDLFQEIEINNQKKYLWCTFSHDQIDLNFKNRDVLLFFIKLIYLYLDQGIKVFRLDAVAFLWKEKGTNCLNLPQTHEVVKLIRTILDNYNQNILLITETNLPNLENLSYFGNGDEANAIYNFTLPPLLLWTLLMGDSTALRKWSMSMPPAKEHTTYFNFIASHDGIGLRPTENILTDQERGTLIDIVKEFGGVISNRKKPDGTETVYELNIALLDAMKGTFKGIDHMQVERFIACHAIMLSLEGIPAFYIHSVLGTTNDYGLMKKNSQNRSINRKSWNFDEIKNKLLDDKSINNQVYKSIINLINIRKKQPAFHPNAIQFTFNLGKNFFGIWRQSLDKRQSIFSVTNVTNIFQYLDLTELNLIESEKWWDLINSKDIEDIKSTIALKAYQTVWISNLKKL
jgi:sucrose phosphorylase